MTSYFSGRHLEQSLNLEIDNFLGSSTKEVSGDVEQQFDELLFFATVLTEFPQIQEAVILSQLEIDSQNPEQLLAQTLAIDSGWIADKRNYPKSVAILNNPLSKILRKIRDKNPDRFGEIFLTDRAGRTLAMTAPLTDYYQADESWWQMGFNGGQGQNLFDDRGYDESVKANVVGAVVPVWSDGKVLGVLKINYRVQFILNHIRNQELDPWESVYLIRSNGEIIASTEGVKGKYAAFNELNPKTLSQMTQRITLGEENFLIAMEPLERNFFSRRLNKNTVLGVSGEQWDKGKWYYLSETNLNQLKGASNNYWDSIVIIGLISVVFSGLIAGIFSRQLNKRLYKLLDGINHVAAGNFEEKINLAGNDEISSLAKSFNLMGEHLARSYKFLEEQVAERTSELEEQTGLALSQTEHFRELLHVLSHDLSNPVASAQSFMEAYESDIINEEEFLGFLKQSLFNATSIIETNRKMMAIDEGKLSANITPCNLKELWEESVLMLSDRLEKKNITVSLDIPESMVIMGEKTTIVNSIFNNALTNAIKFSYRNSKIEIKSKIVEGRIQVALQDYGVGIPEKLLGDLWNPNKPTSMAGTENESGTGYGLPLIKKFMDFFEGSVQIKSAQESAHSTSHGTCLTLNFKPVA
ncbi:MAG: sensor histidine kinase [SAR324 cluster bacterium]|nr:sensor histidine kinase [SAR324 cluster bacterium]